MLKNILFDFGGVICSFNQDDILCRFCADPADHALLKPILFRDWTALDAGTADYDEYARESLSLVPEHLRGLVQRFFDRWYLEMRPLPQTWALIAELKARGYRTYILSNSSTRFAESADCFPIVRLMDGVVFSAPIRMAKPDAAIYRYTLDRFGLTAGESIFIDDNRVNAEAAERCGIHGYAFDGDADRLRAHILALS